MPEESTTPDLEEALRRSVEAVNRHDFDDGLAIYRPDAVWDASPMGLGVFEGRGRYAACLRIGSPRNEDFEQVIEELRDFGNGAIFGVSLGLDD
jgi:hypothetical protein